MQWERYVEIPEKLEGMTEQNALEIFLFLPEIVLKNESVIRQIKEDFRYLFSSAADFSCQRGLIEKAGDGSSEIFSDILKVVNSSGN